MGSDRPELDIPLPRGWTRHVKSAVLHAVSLAATALILARGRAAGGRSTRQRLIAELDRMDTEVAMLKEELAIKDGRWNRLPPRRRPFYTPIQRMRILQLKAARGWSSEQTARTFMINEQTLRSWMRRVDEEGEGSLIQIPQPVNRFPEFVRHLVRQLSTLLPGAGKVRIAQMLARAGLHLGATTVHRILKERVPIPEDEAGVLTDSPEIKTTVVTAKCPDHVWHVDLTTVPTCGGFWVPWPPHAWPQTWPFCWWIAVVIDHFSRAVVGFAVVLKAPTSAEIQHFIERAIDQVGAGPKYIVSDKGNQFWCRSYKQWCERRQIRPRFGAVGKHGSIALIERFIRSMKSEGTRRILVPFTLDAMRRELIIYLAWYNEHRPNQALNGLTPHEVYEGRRPANAMPRLEPRPKWPASSRCASPPARIRGSCGARFSLVVGYLEGRRHLPIVELRRAA